MRYRQTQGTSNGKGDLAKITTNLDNIQKTAKTAVTNAIAAIPVSANLTEASKATVENARKLYDAYVEGYTDYTDYAVAADTYRDGFAEGQLASEFATLAKAEASLGMNYDPVENAKAYVQDLKIRARSAKYYYKAKLVVKDKNGAVVATTPLTQCLYACRRF